MVASTPARTPGGSKHAGAQRPASLLVTGDDRLAETVAPLAAATGHTLHRVRRPADAEPHWQHAPLAIVGADVAEDCLAHGLPVRPGLVLCATMAWISDDPTGTSMLWPLAIRLHADHVIAVPQGTEWLLEHFTRTARDTSPAPVVAAVAGHGGAGASTLALAAATAAAQGGKRVVLIDLDPSGGGIDTAAGLASQLGWRWPSLAARSGQLEPERLLAGLPQREGLHLVAPDTRDRAVPGAEAFERVLHAARIGADLVVVDLPRTRTEAATRAAAAASSLAVAIGPSPRSWEAARGTVAEYALHASRIGMVLRGGVAQRPEPAPDGADPFDAIAPPVWGRVPHDRRLPERLRRGRLPRGRTRRRLHDLMTELDRPRPVRSAAEAGAAR
ncbi:septum site-determining protein Ssd [Glycomyces arizonensis]|uniref:septum site-determining protein Ssd n=1 Tax=Glycomyces arizonensis TaxID=256035 RepID=UPI00041660C1|nr:septum site-determining protein Ssd [Glycomyces arizonensis]